MINNLLHSCGRRIKLEHGAETIILLGPCPFKEKQGIGA